MNKQKMIATAYGNDKKESGRKYKKKKNGTETLQIRLFRISCQRSLNFQ